EKQFYYSPSRAGSDLYADLTLHTTLPGNRYVDLFFTKAASTPTKKGLFYRGDGDDRFESARAGTNTLTPTQTIPSVQYDGASAIVHSRSSLESRDRKIIRAQGGGGLVTSKSMHTVLTYNRTGQYTIGGFDSTEHLIISPGSLRINVDGEDIDTLQYSFVPLTGSVIFKRRDLLDPTSVIIASYTVQTMPDSGLETVELVPKNNFGGIAFGSTTVSPTDWVSIQGGVTSLNTDSLARRRDIGTIVVPVELRLPHPDFLLKLTPELSIQGDNGSTAAALGLQSRLGAWQLGSATSFLLNTVMLDDSFSTTDTLSRGYGKLRSDLNFTVKHDIITELPITYSQADRKSLSGSESFRQASAGVHFRDLPFLDLIWSQNRLSAEQITDGTMADTLKLERNKSKINMRLYELSSPVLQDLLHMNRTGYEFSYTRLTSNKEPDVNPDSTGKQPAMPGTGDILFVSTTLSPISPVTVTGQTTFKQNKQQDWAFDSLAGLPVLTDRRSAEMNPSLTVQTIDAPQGIDLNAYFQSDYRSAADSGLVDIQRSFFIITKPGRWLGTLSWMSPRFGLSEKLTSVFNSRLPGPAGILFGSGGNVSNNLTRTVGLHLYPTGEILVRQENNYTTGDSIQNYYMFNDVKCWFGANRLWQTRYEYNAIDQGADLRVRRHKAFTFYDVTWNSWFRTNEKFSTDYTRKDSVFTDTAAVKRTASLKDLSFGPELSVSFNVQQRGSVKTLVNGHTAKIAWRQQNGRFIPGTEFSYTTFMELIVKPNISIETNNSFSWQQGSATYNGDLTASLLF
nr:hypothetical protein [Chitinispirillaceae bacterium]